MNNRGRWIVKILFNLLVFVLVLAPASARSCMNFRERRIVKIWFNLLVFVLVLVSTPAPVRIVKRDV